MTWAWGAFVCVVLVAFSIGFFLAGFVVGQDVVLDERSDERRRLLEAERMLREMDRAAFTSMLEAAERAGRRDTQPNYRRSLE